MQSIGTSIKDAMDMEAFVSTIILFILFIFIYSMQLRDDN